MSASVHQLEDGRLLIVGKNGRSDEVFAATRAVVADLKIALDETFVVIDPALLSDYRRYSRTSHEQTGQAV